MTTIKILLIILGIIITSTLGYGIFTFDGDLIIFSSIFLGLFGSMLGRELWKESKHKKNQQFKNL